MEPFWFETLDKQKQIVLIAEYQLEEETQKEYKKRKDRYMRGLICQ